jgi:hypothetical protein
MHVFTRIFGCSNEEAPRGSNLPLQCRLDYCPVRQLEVRCRGIARIAVY